MNSELRAYALAPIVGVGGVTHAIGSEIVFWASVVGALALVIKQVVIPVWRWARRIADTVAKTFDRVDEIDERLRKIETYAAAGHSLRNPEARTRATDNPEDMTS